MVLPKESSDANTTMHLTDIRNSNGDIKVGNALSSVSSTQDIGAITPIKATSATNLSVWSDISGLKNDTSQLTAYVPKP